MKNRSWLFVSLGLNLALMSVVVQEWRARPKCGAYSPSGLDTTVWTVRRPNIPPETNPARIEIAAPFHWRQIESADYCVYAQNLRSIGCPEETVRDIIVADVNELFAGRVKELVDGVSGRFWNLMLNGEEMEKIVEEKQKELEALEDERAEIFAAILNQKDPVGELQKAEEREMDNARRIQMLDFLEENKRTQVVDFENRFRASAEGLEHSGESLTGGERERKLKELVLEKEQRIRGVLTTAEYEEYQLRTSPAAHVCSALADFDASQEELRAITRVKMMQSLTQAQADEQIRQLLGDDRFATFQHASDDSYREAIKITDRFGLPEETAGQVFQMRREAEARAKIIREAAMPVEERQALLKTMQAETEKSISTALGSKAFTAYQKYGDGWLARFADDVR